jgi:hypothetical protein
MLGSWPTSDEKYMKFQKKQVITYVRVSHSTEFPKYSFSLYKPVTLAKYVEKVDGYAASMKTEEIRTEFLSTNFKPTEHSGVVVLHGRPILKRRLRAWK